MTVFVHRACYDLKGTVQGVGFRPTLYRLACESGLGGSVQNRSGSVRLVLDAERPQEIGEFIERLPSCLPPHARIESVVEISQEILCVSDWNPSFLVLPSEGEDVSRVSIPADLVMCAECRAEVLNPEGRRYGYAFTTCTNCGPRYTVINGMPYDRERTTMDRFPLCDACRIEYENPGDRRFHAETIACPQCGPQLRLEVAARQVGRELDANPLRGARSALAEGAIVAVRGIGGYLLAADAFNRKALQTLRTRKIRPDKPFAVMAPDLETARRYCDIDEEAGRLLESSSGPIVICNAREGTGLPLDLISPDTGTLGIMLPTSPLHCLLSVPLEGDAVPRFDLLIMTSGNRGGEPICLTNDEACQRLLGIADYFLMHDREINLRNDDSLCTMQYGGFQVWRRARGFAPAALLSPLKSRRCVLGMGAELKNAIALGFEDRIIASPHIGDLESPEAVDGLEFVTCALPRFLEREPEIVAVDLHPDMQCTRIGRRIAEELNVPVVEVQHHHAHGAACLVEHGRAEGLALVMDGTGMGSDGYIWGAELLEITPGDYRRLASFEGVPLPGGDSAVRQPARQLVARWIDAGLDPTPQWSERLGVTDEEIGVWKKQCVQGINAPITHAAGRLFDAFSVALGIAPESITYEGQSAIRFEATALRCGTNCAHEVPYSAAERDGMLWIDWSDAFRICELREPGTDHAAAWALAVHRAVANAALAMIQYGLSRSQCRTVALSGGVFMNKILTELLVPKVQAEGVEVLLHRQTPPNDGCIAIGQVAIAGAQSRL